MANQRAVNGIQDTLQRLFGHTEHRKLLTKYVRKGVLKEHMKSSNPHVFKRSTECDNLIKNILALDVAFGSQDLVAKVIQGKISHKEVSQHIKKEREKLDTKFRAYGYWLNRMNSLDETLDSSFNFEQSALEDVLKPEGTASFLAPSSPYALRAVKLLEKVEEEGRLSKISPDRLSEKAWALYSLGLSKQAAELALEATNEDPECSEAWMLLAINFQRQQHKAATESSHYALEKEFAEPMSSHERWAEEMESDAIDKYFASRRAEKEILFPALLHWPKDSDSKTSESFKHPANRKTVRNACVDWLFRLLKPFNNYAGSVDLFKAYAMNGLAPEFEMKEELRGFESHRINKLPAHGLNETEVKVAEMLCSEFDANRRGFFSILEPDCHALQLKLLHVRFALGLDGYNEAHAQFIRELENLRISDVQKFISQYDLFNALFTHLSHSGFEALKQNLESRIYSVQDGQNPR